MTDEGVLHERLAALSLERKVRLLTGADFWALHAEPAVGLRRVVTSDGPAGVRGETWDDRDTAANVPSPTALAATWDEDRVERIGRLLAAEARRKGVDVLLAPTVNLHRSPYGGRHFECFSEDPLLTARIGTAYVRGVQGAGVAATVKHVVANDSETERFTLDARVDQRTLREVYLAPFEAILRDAGAWAVMAAYNGVNGHTMTEHPLLRDVLEAEWGFDGVVMSDWFATRSTEAAAAAGVDLAMPGPGGPWGDALVAAVRTGRVAEADVDRKVLRILRLAARVGALDGVPPAAPPPDPYSREAMSEELRAAAAAGFVLARNAPSPHSASDGAAAGDGRGVLPLDRDRLGRVAVLGPNAAVARTLGGGSATVFPPYTVSPLAGLRAALGAERVVHATGVRTSDRPAAAGGEVEVLLLDADGAVLRREQRTTGRFTAMGSFGPEVDDGAVAAVELRTTLRAATAGEHQVGAAGIGPFRLAADGREVLAAELTLPAGADPAALLHPPVAIVPLALAEGQEVDLVLHHTVARGAGAVCSLLADPPHAPEDQELERAVALARAADVAIVVVGTTEEVESEGFDRDSLALPGRQDELVRRVAAVNPRTVVVVNAGAPVLLPWADEVAAVLLAWFPGQEFGHALADVLLGVREPGGRLPTTWPATERGLPSTRPADGVLPYMEGLHVGHRDPARDVRFPFGHGLGYTTWAYGQATVTGDTVRVPVTNTGARAGREVVQVYASRPDSAVERPRRWLAGYAAVEAAPGATVVAQIRLGDRALAHWDVSTGSWHREPGAFHLAIGPSSADLPTEADAGISPARAPR